MSHDNKLPEDFAEKTNKVILLTGAGFSKNAGGYLASEFSRFILNDDTLSDDVKHIIKKYSFDYELAYDQIKTEDKELFKETIKEIFKKMDADLKNKVNDQYGNLKFLYDSLLKESKYNFIITLNQDLMLERCFIKYGKEKQDQLPIQCNEDFTKKLSIKNISLHFPFNNYCMGLVIKSKYDTSCAIQSQNSYDFDQFTQVIKFEPSKNPEKGLLNYIKLHGSAHWQHSEGTNVIISGGKKITDLNKYAVLKASFQLFQQICEFPDLRIIIFGYSFQDSHINEQIFNAIKNGAKLCIIDSKSIQEFNTYIINYLCTNQIREEKF